MSTNPIHDDDLGFDLGPQPGSEELQTDLITTYCKLRDRYDLAKAKADEAWQAVRRAEARLSEVFAENGTESLKTADGITFALANTASLSVTRDNVDDVRDFIESLGEDSTMFLREAFDKPAIQELVLEKIADQKLDKEDIPDTLRPRFGKFLRVSGWKKRRYARE